MNLNETELADYVKTIDEIVCSISDPAKSASLMPEAIAARMIPGQPANIRVQMAIKGAAKAHTIMFTWGDFKNALAHFTKLWAAAEAQDAYEQKMLTALGTVPRNERQYIDAFMASRGFDMDFHRKFFIPGDTTTDLSVEDIAHDARLTAGDLNLIKPRGKVLSVTEIGVALSEWANQRRHERKQNAADRVAYSPDRHDATIDTEFLAVCYLYFKEAAFAEAACRKFIWSTKRKLLGLTVPQVHMVVLVGPQDTGKTKFAEKLYSPLDELTVVVSLPDLLDTRQMDMPSYFVAFCDEMVFNEDAKPAQLKSFLTGTTQSRRPMRTNISERIQINVTPLGTANHSLDRLIYDSSGMRRFVEIVPRTRKEIEPYWDRIMKFDWLRLWQSINPMDPDPLISQYNDELMRKQESIRNLDNVEMWLQYFDPSEHKVYARKGTAAEFYAQELYEIFRRWEDEYCPGNYKTSLQRWGREMRSLIDNRRVTGWTYQTLGNRTVYGAVAQQDEAQDASDGRSVIPFGHQAKH